MGKKEYFEKAMDFFCEDKLEPAIEELRKALEEDPSYADALHAIAMSYYHLGDIDQAIEYGETLRTVEPNKVHGYTSLSMFYNAKGFIAKAEEMAAIAARLESKET